MDQNVSRNRSTDGDLAILDAMRQWVAEPMEKRMEALEAQNRDLAVQMREALAAMRDDFRAAIAATTNPETGYVPRTEIKLLFEKVDEQVTSLKSDFQQRERERSVNFRWAIGTVIGIATVIATTISVIVPILHQSPH